MWREDACLYVLIVISIFFFRLDGSESGLRRSAPVIKFHKDTINPMWASGDDKGTAMVNSSRV